MSEESSRSRSALNRTLPDRPNLNQLKKQAKDLLKAYRQGESQAMKLVQHFERRPDDGPLGLQDAQRVLARSYSFSSWTALRERVIIETIKLGDAKALIDILESVPDPQQLLNSRIKDPQPTNHAIGQHATLLQFASFRSWQGENTSETLLKNGASLDIHSACALAMTEEIEAILARNPDAIHGQVDTYFPIQFAITAAQVASIDCLMKYGDDPNRDLKKMAYFGWEDDVRDLEFTPWKPIHMASLWGFDAKRIPVAEGLKRHGADLNAVSPLDGYRPIHLVSMPNRVDMIRFYVANGVDVDSRTARTDVIQLKQENAGPLGDSFECTPLMVACGEGFVEAAECLLELGADVNALDDQGHTALHFAEKRFWQGQPYDRVIEALLARGAHR